MEAVDPAAPVVLNEAQRRGVLRRCLASALRSGGHGILAEGEVATPERPSQAFETAAALVLVLSVWLGVADLLDGAWWTWPAAGIALVAASAVVSTASSSLAGVVLVLAWPVTLALSIIDEQHWGVTHVLPVTLLLIAALVTRQMDVRTARDIALAVAAIPRTAPLVAPLVLVVLVLPTLSEDVWKVADHLSASRIVGLALVTVGALFVLVNRQLRSELPVVLSGRAETLGRSAARGDATRQALQARLSGGLFRLVASEADAFLADAWPPDGAQYAPLIAADSHSRLARPLMGRLGLCLLFVAVSVSAYLYVLMSVLLPPTVVEGWTEAPVPFHDVELIWVTIHAPAGPYLPMTALLTCLAVASFLAFALIEERFSIALVDGLLRLPTDQLLALALPFLHLMEERITGGDPLPPDFDLGAFEG